MKKWNYIFILIAILLVVLIAVFDPEHLGGAIFPALIAGAIGYSKFAVAFRQKYEYKQLPFIILCIIQALLIGLLMMVGIIDSFNSGLFCSLAIICLICSLISLFLFFVKYVKKKI